MDYKGIRLDFYCKWSFFFPCYGRYLVKAYLINSEKMAGKSHLGHAVMSSLTT